MKLSFDNWVISKDTALLGYQYDNESQELWVTGDLPQGWTWDALIQDGSHYDVWPLTLAERGAYITLNDENLAVPGSFYIQIRGTKGEQVQHTNIVSVYISRSLVGPGTWPTLPTEFSQAEKAIKELNAHPPIPGENGFWLLWNLDTSSYEESQLPVPVGPAGPANVLEMGEVTTLAPEEAATAELTGESPHQVLHLGLPQGKTGDPGPTGPTPQLTVGEVTTLDQEESATAELSGTPEKPVLNLGIPQGKTGQPGPIGNPGPANTLQVGQVTTLAPDQPATAEITGASPTQTLNLGLPQGKTGPTGATPELTMGEVTTLDPEEPATAELSGTPEKPVLNLGIPQGHPGKDGVQLEDDAVTSTAAWSSRKIVEALCPSFEVSGNPVTCQPVEGYPLDVKVNFGPIQAGEGDPSPENVRPISGRDSLTLTRCGKNLCGEELVGYPYPESPQVGLRYGIQSGVLPEGTYCYYAEYKTEDQNAQYVYACGVYEDGSYSTGVRITRTEGKITPTGSLTFTKPARLFVYAAGSVGGTPEGAQAILSLVNVIFAYKNQPDHFEPYQGDTYDIALPETVYGGTLDVISGVLTADRILLTVDNETAISCNGVNAINDGFTSFYVELKNLTAFYLDCLNDNPISNYFKDGGVGSQYNTANVFWISAVGTVNAYVGFTIKSELLGLTEEDDNSSAIQKLKAYLSTSPFSFCIGLATPRIFEVASHPIQALPGANTLYTDGDRVTVAGKQDLTYTLRQIQEQLAAVSGVTEALTGTD